MFIVVGVLVAVSYRVAEYEWIFFCVSWSIPCSSLSDPWYCLHTACVSADFFSVYYGVFLYFTPGHLCICPVCSE